MQSIPALNTILTPTMAMEAGLTIIVTDDLPFGAYTTYAQRLGATVAYIVTLGNSVICLTTQIDIAKYCHRRSGGSAKRG